jgi:hypothetical protein
MARAESVAPATRLCACTSTLDASDSVFLSSKRSAFATCREEDTCASFQASTALRTAYFFFFFKPEFCQSRLAVASVAPVSSAAHAASIHHAVHENAFALCRSGASRTRG